MRVFPLSLSASSLLFSSSVASPAKTPKTLTPKAISGSSFCHLNLRHRRRNLSAAAYGDDDGDAPDFADGEYDYEPADDDKDYEIEYDGLALETFGTGDDLTLAPLSAGGFMNTEGWEAESVVNYRINEEEFHKINLWHCDFFIRRPPDPDDNVFDFREMYVSPPDMDIYSIPKVLAPMPQKYIRCAKKNFGFFNTTEPPVDTFRDPLHKMERQIHKVFLTKHYGNRRESDEDFVLDFEEIYVIDSKTKSITRAKVVVTAPGGKDRDRKRDLLLIRDGGNSFKIADRSEREDPQTVIEKKDWVKSRDSMEKYLRKLKDFEQSNWF